MNIKSIVQFLAGKKTYLLGIAGVIYSLGIARNWWPNDASVWGLLGSAGAMTLRAAVTKIVTQFLDDMTKASATPSGPALGTSASTKSTP